MFSFNLKNLSVPVFGRDDKGLFSNLIFHARKY